MFRHFASVQCVLLIRPAKKVTFSRENDVVGFLLERVTFFVVFFQHVSEFSFGFFLLQASEAEFNQRCFLRSRCSMKTWCPDNIGRIAGIGLGHLSRREHHSTPQNGVGSPRSASASSRKKTERPRLDCCVCREKAQTPQTCFLFGEEEEGKEEVTPSAQSIHDLPQIPEHCLPTKYARVVMLFCPSFTQSERFLQTDQLITRLQVVVMTNFIRMLMRNVIVNVFKSDAMIWWAAIFYNFGPPPFGPTLRPQPFAPPTLRAPTLRSPLRSETVSWRGKPVFGGGSLPEPFWGVPSREKKKRIHTNKTGFQPFTAETSLLQDNLDISDDPAKHASPLLEEVGSVARTEMKTIRTLA